MTKVKKQVLIASLSSIHKFLISFTRDLYINEKIESIDNWIIVLELYKKYNNWNKENNSKFTMTTTKFGLELRNCDINKDKKDGYIKYNMTYNKITNKLTT